MAARWATFDCYGTLADWRRGMTAAVEPIAGERTPRFMSAYYEEELAVQSERPSARYRDVLAEGLRRAAARTGVALAPGQDHVLSDAWGAMPIFPDTRQALEQLVNGGWRLAILSNCDDDLLAQTVAAIGVDFDLLVTAEQVGSYKPAPGHWERFAQSTAGRRDVWVHCANSLVHDMRPAHGLGISRVWVDRDRPGASDVPVDAHIHAMAELPAALGARDWPPSRWRAPAAPGISPGK